MYKRIVRVITCETQLEKFANFLGKRNVCDVRAGSSNEKVNA